MLVWFGQRGRRAWPGTAGLGAGKAEWAQPTAQHRGVLGHRMGFPGDQGSPLNVYVHKRLLSEARHLAKLWALPSFAGSKPGEGPAGACVSSCASEALRTICPAAQSGLRRWHGTWDRCPLSDVVPDGYAAGLCGLEVTAPAPPLSTRPYCRGFHASVQQTHLLCPWAAPQSTGHQDFLLEKKGAGSAALMGVCYRLGCSMLGEWTREVSHGHISLLTAESSAIFWNLDGARCQIHKCQMSQRIFCSTYSIFNDSG